MKEGDLIDGRYCVTAVLGQGGMGQVFQCQDVELNRTVAVKLLFLNATDLVIKRFVIEAKSLAQVDHPSVMKVLDFGQADDGKLFLVMEFIKGDSLSKLLEKRGSLSFLEALPIFEKVCEGIRHAHAKEVLHRDIKPSNVMLADDRVDFVKVVDFGLAKQNNKDEQELTKTGAAMGSPPYMSPEAVLGTPVDARSDVYSLGCLLFEVLAGRAPFVADTPFATMMQQVKKEAPTLQEISGKEFDPEIEAFVKRCIEKKPEDRFQSVEHLLHALDSVKNTIHQKLAAPVESSGVWAKSGVFAQETFLKSKKPFYVVGAIVLILCIAIPLYNFCIEDTIKKDNVALTHDPGESAVKASDALSEKQMSESFKGRTHVTTGVTVVDDKLFPGQQACVFEGNVTHEQIHENMKLFLDKSILHIREFNADPKVLHNAITSPTIKYVALLHTAPVTNAILKMAAEKKDMNYIGVTECPDLGPEGLKPFQSVELRLLSIVTGPKDDKGLFDAIGGLKTLYQLELQDCDIDKNEMRAIAKLPLLRLLNFRKCTFAPGAVAELEKSKLYGVGFLACTLTPEQIKQATQIKSVNLLDLTHSTVDDKSVADLSACIPHLNGLNLTDTDVSEEAADKLRQLKPGIQFKHGRRTRIEDI